MFQRGLQFAFVLAQQQHLWACQKTGGFKGAFNRALVDIKFCIVNDVQYRPSRKAKRK